MGFFFARPDRNEASGGVFLYQPDPKRFIRNSMLNVYSGRQWNADHLLIGGWTGINGNVNFTNFWNVFIGLTRRPAQYDDVGARGGPPIFSPPASWMNVRVESDSRKQWEEACAFSRFITGSAAIRRRLNPMFASSHRSGLWPQLASSSPRRSTTRSGSRTTDADGDATEDNVYGTLRNHQINITTRATYSFTRDMTLEAYVQPFVAVGNYFDIRKHARTKSYEFTPVTLADDPDFNKKSVRGTIVLRWEYLRGSTVFAVWNLATSDEDARKGIYSPWRDLRGAFGAPGTIPSRSN
jgi:hypothetical protein